MRKLLAALLAALCILGPAAALAEADADSGDNLLINADFSLYADSAALPAGWELDAYAPDDTLVRVEQDAQYGNCVSIENAFAADTRVCQTVSVESDSVYRVGGYVRTADVSGGTGASLSVDNYALDGTYCYSENLHGTNNWRWVEMYVRTGPEQTALRIALRLGGYSTMASGTAAFADITVTAASSGASDDVIDLMSENGSVSGYSADQADTPEERLGSGGFVLIVAAVLLCGAAYVWLYRSHLRYADAALVRVQSGKTALWMLLLAALICRVLLSLIFYGHATDINCFMAWGNAVLNGGPANFYTSGMFADYPPGYMYVCAALSWVCKVLNIGYGTDGMALVFKLPAIAADLVSAWLVYRLAHKNGLSETVALALAGTVAFCPVLMYVSGAWGQIDTLLTLLLVLTCVLLQSGKRVPAGALYGLAILLKPQALILGPLLAVAYLIDIAGPDWKRKLVETVLAVLAAVLVMFVLSVPFRGTQGWGWLIGKYRDTAGSYPYASIEAFNFPALLGGNWQRVDTTALGRIYQVVGTVCIILSVLFSACLYLFGCRRSRGALYLSGAVMILLIFTFGHFMHERYMLPALLMLLVAYLYYRDRRLLIAFGLSGTAALWNVLLAMFIVNRQELRGASYEILTRLGSALTVFACVYAVYAAVMIVFFSETLPPLKQPAAVRNARGADAGGRAYTLPSQPTDDRLRWTRRDLWSVSIVTLIYGVVALTNLGTTKAPQTVWAPTQVGQTVLVEFDGTRHVKEFWVNGNIGNSGVLLVSGGGTDTTYKQVYDDMFLWKTVDTDFVSDRAAVTAYSGGLQLNELAFFDADGARIPVTITGGDETAKYLFDEQDTVPEVPGCFNGMYFDELYHGRTAYEHLHNLAPYENSHPPLGKLLIMLGIAVFGMCPFGWRVVGAVFGIAMLPLLYAFGKRLFKDSRFALVATVLFAFDFMHFTQTRIATIDVYAVFFVLLMYYYMYRYVQMNFFVDGLNKTLRPLALAGLFFGIGAACKWTCIYAGAGLAVLLLLSLVERYFEYRHTLQSGTKAQRALVACYWVNVRKTVLWCCLFYIVIPVAVYFASYTPYYICSAGQSKSYGFSDMCKTFWHYQEFMYNYHTGLNATHPYQSAWYEWPFTVRPIWYFFNSHGGKQFVSTLSASGNPAVWWVSSIGAVTLLGLRLGNRIKPDRALWIFCVGVLANYLPWVLVTRCTFIYHFFATVPFILLATVYLVEQLEQRRPAYAWVKWAWAALAVALFILLYPGLSGLPVSPAWAAFLKQLPGGKLMYGA